jgi:hypothetical protein
LGHKSKRSVKSIQAPQFIYFSFVNLSCLVVFFSSFFSAWPFSAWPGRNQTIRRDRIVYLIDGAHTPDSAALCAEWAATEFAAMRDTGAPVVRVLWFNVRYRPIPHYSHNSARPSSKETSKQKNKKIKKNERKERERRRAKENKGAERDLRAHFSDLILLHNNHKEKKRVKKEEGRKLK